MEKNNTYPSNPLMCHVISLRFGVYYRHVVMCIALSKFYIYIIRFRLQFIQILCNLDRPSFTIQYIFQLDDSEMDTPSINMHTNINITVVSTVDTLPHNIVAPNNVLKDFVSQTHWLRNMIY